VTVWAFASAYVPKAQSQLKKDIPSNLTGKKPKLNPGKKISLSIASPAGLAKTSVTSSPSGTKCKASGSVLAASLN